MVSTDIYIRSACTSFSTESQQNRDSHTYFVPEAQERMSGVANVSHYCRPVGILADVSHTAMVVGDAEINGVSRRCHTGAAVSIIPLRPASELTFHAPATKLGMIIKWSHSERCWHL